jgi:hypothetical protein
VGFGTVSGIDADDCGGGDGVARGSPGLAGGEWLTASAGGAERKDEHPLTRAMDSRPRATEVRMAIPYVGISQ